MSRRILLLATLATFGAMALLLGFSTPSVGCVALCIGMMAFLYDQSGDALDARAAVYAATLLFICIPGMVFEAQTRDTHYWTADLVGRLVVARDEIVAAELAVLCGLVALSAVFIGYAPSESVPAESSPMPRKRVWLIYAASVAALGVLAASQYGGLTQMIFSAVSPLARAEARTSSGLAAIALFAGSISAYFAGQRVQQRWQRLVLFLPLIALIIPAGSRGSLLSVVLIAAIGAFSFRTRHPMRRVLAACLLLPPLASLMFRFRRLAVLDSFGDFRVSDLYADFAQESLMLPAFAYVLRALKEEAIRFSYGIDLVMLPLWYVPRAIWPAKPLPLDFRLNDQLGLHDGVAFGTPIGIFGGFYVNFTPLGYLPAMVLFGCIVAYWYRRIACDRLYTVLLFTFVIDIVRVGDISRELLTFSLALGSALLIRKAIRPRALAQ